MPTPGDAPPAIFDRFPLATDRADRRRLWLQIAIVLCVAVLLDTYAAVRTWLTPIDQRPVYPHHVWALWAIMRSISVCVPLLGIAALTCESPRSMGLRPFGWADVGLIVLLYILTSAAHTLLWPTVTDNFGVTRWGHHTFPTTTWQWAISGVADLANGFAEELAIWGVLYTRLRRVMGGYELPPLLLAAGTFASYHIYQGVDNAVMVFIYGLVHGVYFRLCKRLWPLAIGHGAGNILNMLVW